MRNIKLIIYIFLFSHLVFSQTKDPLMSEDFEKQSVWVDSIYNSMTLDEKIGQLFSFKLIALNLIILKK